MLALHLVRAARSVIAEELLIFLLCIRDFSSEPLPKERSHLGDQLQGDSRV